MAAIHHLVVLMLENRSFDHLLGYYVPREEGARGGPRVAGLTGTEFNLFNPEDPSAGSCAVHKTEGTDGYTTDPDPRHEHADAMVDLFCDPRPPAETAPKNGGFLFNYAKLEVNGTKIPPETASQIMACFDVATQLPAVMALAENFLVLDHWFSSLPGPTWPNRFFAHCATSGGLSGSPSDLSSLFSVEGMSPFGMPTIYENLAAIQQDWRIYYHDVPQALALERLHPQRAKFQHIAQFFQDAAAGTLPPYCFLEPAFFNSSLLGLIANDMHPSHDVRHGDQLVAAVYNALRQGPAWAETALLLLWDEHGGFYDHLPPPRTVSPDGRSDGSGFDFTQLGVRVPAILVSPRVARGGVVSTVFDHSSIPATVKSLFGTPTFLTRRDAEAASFDGLFQLATARLDAPLSIAGAGGAPPPSPATSTILSDNQQRLLELANALPLRTVGRTSASARTDSLEASLSRVASYLAT
jgi:phospholipase C